VGPIRSMHDTLVRAVNKLKTAIEEDFPETYRDHRGLQRALKIIADSNRVIENGSERVTTIVRSLRNFTRLDEDQLQEADIHAALDDSLMLIHHDIKHRIEVTREYGPVPPLQCYPGRLNQAFLNILNNAQQAIPDKGTITITTTLHGNEAHVAIADTGSGIPAELRAKIFAPGVTTKGVGKGTGLGLSICLQIIQDHKGRL
jgi:signal transduction histidine kinase